MSWRVVARPDAQIDIAEAAQWYEARREGLGSVLGVSPWVSPHYRHIIKS